MKLSTTQINHLKELLEQELGLKYKDGELEQVALTIVRFVYSKEVQKLHSINKDNPTEQSNE